MPDFALLFTLCAVGFVLNLLWEFPHSRLYTTCRNQSWRKNTPLLMLMSLKDGFFITLFYSISFFIFRNENILENIPQLSFFIVLALGFSFVDEKISIRLKRWEYAPTMPLVLGVGLTPFLEVACTGILAFLIVFRYIYSI